MRRAQFCLIASIAASGCASTAGSNASKGTAPEAHDHDASHSVRRTYLTPEEGPGIIQSPVNILTTEAQEGAARVRLHYGAAEEHVKNLGHTVEVDVDDASNWVEVDGERFELLQFHFHTPSEHLLDGVTYPMEMHLVHRKAGTENQYLVIGVLFKEGRASPLIDSFLNQIPQMEGDEGPKGVVDLGPFLRPDEGYYAYRGSLTTPPYTETVRWYISKEIHVASPEQVESIYAIEGDNARHIQVFRGRRVYAE